MTRFGLKHCNTHLRCPNLTNVHLFDVVVLDLNLNNNSQILHGVLHPLPGQVGQVYLHSSSRVCPQLNLVLLGGEDGRLARLVY